MVCYADLPLRRGFRRLSDPASRRVAVTCYKLPRHASLTRVNNGSSDRTGTALRSPAPDARYTYQADSVIQRPRFPTNA